MLTSQVLIKNLVVLQASIYANHRLFTFVEKYRTVGSLADMYREEGGERLESYG